MSKTNGHTAQKTITGIFGIKLPENFKYKVTSQGELKEVEWLIKEGVYKNLEEYEEYTTKRLLGQVK